MYFFIMSFSGGFYWTEEAVLLHKEFHVYCQIVLRASLDAHLFFYAVSYILA